MPAAYRAGYVAGVPGSDPAPVLVRCFLELAAGAGLRPPPPTDPAARSALVGAVLAEIAAPVVRHHAGAPARAPSADATGGPADQLQAARRRLLATDPDRRRRGAWYTPPALVAALLDLGLEPVLDERPPEQAPPVVVDPACGDGAFLVAVLARLVGRGWPPATALAALHGVDADPVAVITARLALWLAAADPTLPLGAVAGVVAHGDALGPDATSALGAPAWRPGPRLAPGADLVVGNPPFANPMRSTGAQRRATTAALAERFVGDVTATTNPAAAFLALAVDLARPDGGRVALVQPSSTLGARHAERVRRRVEALAPPTDLWVDDGTAFDAAVHAVAVVGQRGGPPGPVRCWRGLPPEPVDGPGRLGGPTWGPLAAPAFGVPAVHLGSPARLGDVATVGADFRDEYYALADVVVDLGAGAGLTTVDPGVVPVVTVGLIDPAACWWGRRPTRLHRRALLAPAVPAEDLAADPVLARWADRRLHPKVLVATQGRVLEPVVDLDGRWLPSVPVVSIVAPPDRLWHLAAALLSPATTALAAARHLGTGLVPTALKLAASDLAALPLPDEGPAWDEAARATAAAQAAATAGDLDGWRAGVEAAADAVLGAQRLGAGDRTATLAWWRSRLGRRPRLAP